MFHACLTIWLRKPNLHLTNRCCCMTSNSNQYIGYFFWLIVRQNGCMYPYLNRRTPNFSNTPDQGFEGIHKQVSGFMQETYLIDNIQVVAKISTFPKEFILKFDFFFLGNDTNDSWPWCNHRNIFAITLRTFITSYIHYIFPFTTDHDSSLRVQNIISAMIPRLMGPDKFCHSISMPHFRWIYSCVHKRPQSSPYYFHICSLLHCHKTWK